MYAKFICIITTFLQHALLLLCFILVQFFLMMPPHFNIHAFMLTSGAVWCNPDMVQFWVVLHYSSVIDSLFGAVFNAVLLIVHETLLICLLPISFTFAWCHLVQFWHGVVLCSCTLLLQPGYFYILVLFWYAELLGGPSWDSHHFAAHLGSVSLPILLNSFAVFALQHVYCLLLPCYSVLLPWYILLHVALSACLFKIFTRVGERCNLLGCLRDLLFKAPFLTIRINCLIYGSNVFGSKQRKLKEHIAFYLWKQRIY